MILRRGAARQRSEWGRRAPLRWQLSLVTALMVAIAVGLMTVVTYWVVSTALTRNVDVALKEKAESLISETVDPAFLLDPAAEVTAFKSYNPDTRAMVYIPGSPNPIGDSIQLVSEIPVVQGNQELSIRNAGEERVLALHGNTGATVVLAQDMATTHRIISNLGMVLLLIAIAGVLMAIATGIVVASTGLRPISRLQQAVNYVARTDELRPMAVVGTDEIAQLTRSFNDMLAALQASRDRQTELVADAGHELKTPLTSLRTNVELLMMVSKQKNAMISEEDRQAIEKDVVAQIQEMSTLIGDLVDLAREDGSREFVAEDVDLMEVMDTSLERVKRRRPDVAFAFNPYPWKLKGDPFALGRATLNLMDNAAKWSPRNGTVRIDMKPVESGMIQLTFADSGPGIPLADRDKVFERFYRSAEARSMPGSGLGLAIVKSVINRHNGTITVGDSDDGGNLMTVFLPGSAGDLPADDEEEVTSSQEDSSRSDFLTQLWQRRKYRTT
ncbi:MAG: HAMP domain-containing sensor histidine kinase [Corynebacterium glucuronolyticum]|nr:HAMP domain-containing histidine kinase [Corynebacterium glucuronolyticum]MDD7587097.1 HAMP domain-containing sensor histidine kinase [Mycobacteriaceae bacterium]MDY5834784.1 HAMP domain-containing sensor histidine kinase [Corynebacterium glucuronolyticum]